jgi:hypothetical protein
MADVPEPTGESGQPNRTLFYIIGAVVALFLIVGLVKGSKKTSTTPPEPPANARAVVVPTDDAARTVIVAPCETAVADTTRDAEKNVSTPNTVRVKLPRGSGDRAILVPHCNQSGAVAPSVPSAAFILTVGSRSKELQVPPLRAESQVLVPSGGKARTVVVSPCTGKIGGVAGRPSPAAAGGRQQDVVLEPQKSGSTVATAPQC